MTEAKEQSEFVAWFKECWPEHVKSLRCSMNGLPRHGRQGAILWNIMKGLGVQKGEPDIAILLPKGGYGAFLAEHKRGNGTHKITPEQFEQLEYHESIGNYAISTRGLDELKKSVMEYMEQ